MTANDDGKLIIEILNKPIKEEKQKTEESTRKPKEAPKRTNQRQKATS